MYSYNKSGIITFGKLKVTCICVFIIINAITPLTECRHLTDTLSDARTLIDTFSIDSELTNEKNVDTQEANRQMKEAHVDSTASITDGILVVDGHKQKDSSSINILPEPGDSSPLHQQENSDNPEATIPVHTNIDLTTIQDTVPGLHHMTEQFNDIAQTNPKLSNPGAIHEDNNLPTGTSIAVKETPDNIDSNIVPENSHIVTNTVDDSIQQSGPQNKTFESSLETSRMPERPPISHLPTDATAILTETPDQKMTSSVSDNDRSAASASTSNPNTNIENDVQSATPNNDGIQNLSSEAPKPDDGNRFSDDQMGIQEDPLTALDANPVPAAAVSHSGEPANSGAHAGSAPGASTHSNTVASTVASHAEKDIVSPVPEHLKSMTGDLTGMGASAKSEETDSTSHVKPNNPNNTTTTSNGTNGITSHVLTDALPIAVIETPHPNGPPPTQRTRIADLAPADLSNLDHEGDGDIQATALGIHAQNGNSTGSHVTNSLHTLDLTTERQPEDMDPLGIFVNDITYQRFPRPMSLTDMKEKVLGKSLKKLYILEETKKKLFGHVRQLEVIYTLEDDTLYANFLFRFVFSRKCEEIQRFRLGKVVGNTDQAMFEKELPDGRTERIVLFSNKPDDYVYFMSCTDMAVSPYACRGDYYISLDTVRDPPNHFPWAHAAAELENKMKLTFEDPRFIFNLVLMPCARP